MWRSPYSRHAITFASWPIFRKSCGSGGSYTTWILFGLSHLSTAAYALLVISDPVMAAVFVGNAACCITILALTAYKQAVHARAALSMRPPLALRLLDAAPEAVPDRR